MDYWNARDDFRQFTIDRATQPSDITNDDIILGLKLARIFDESSTLDELQKNLDTGLDKEDREALFDEDSVFKEILTESGLKLTPEEDIEVSIETDLESLRGKILKFVTAFDDEEKYRFKALKEAYETNNKTKIEDYWKYVDGPELDDITSNIENLEDQLEGIQILEIEIRKLKKLIGAAYRDGDEEVQELLSNIHQTILDPSKKIQFFYEWLNIDKGKLKELAKERLPEGNFQWVKSIITREKVQTELVYPEVAAIVDQAEKMGFVLDNNDEALAASALVFTQGNVSASAKLLIDHKSRF